MGNKLNKEAKSKQRSPSSRTAAKKEPILNNSESEEEKPSPKVEKQKKPESQKISRRNDSDSNSEDPTPKAKNEPSPPPRFSNNNSQSQNVKKQPDTPKSGVKSPLKCCACPNTRNEVRVNQCGHSYCSECLLVKKRCIICDELILNTSHAQDKKLPSEKTRESPAAPQNCSLCRKAKSDVQANSCGHFYCPGCLLLDDMDLCVKCDKPITLRDSNNNVQEKKMSPKVGLKKPKTNEKTVLKFKDGSEYVGETRNGKMHGQGVLTWENDANSSDNYKYEGEFKDGLKCGYGKISVNTGLYFDDEEDDVKNWVGWKLGKYVYEGEWKNNKKNGKGVVHPDESTYFEGEFRDDDTVGIIKEYLSGILHFEGKFRNGVKLLDGPAKVYNPYDGELYYDGEWKNEKRHGQGTQYSTYGYYTGEFRNDEKDGYFKRYSPSGVIEFEGFYKGDDLVKGKVVKNYKDGILVYEGGWDDRCDNRHGKGKEYCENGDYYEGTFKDDRKEGKFKGYSSNGKLIFEGTFKDNERDGKGKNYIDGVLEYEGEYFCDMKYGKGKLYKNGKVIFNGEFENDEPVKDDE